MKLPVIINSGLEGPTVLISAGVHGDEYEPIIAAYRVASLLKGKLIAGKLIIVPYVNETAVEARSRYGNDGLDLARVCPGDPEGSSTMKDAAAISELIKASDYLVDLHTGGRIFDIYPLAGYMLHPNIEVLEKQRKMAKAFGLPVLWGTDHEPNGRTLSVARDALVPSIYVEYGGGSSVSQEIIEAYVNGCLNVLKMIGLYDGESRRNTELRYWVEDGTPMKGHLQSKTPAPCSGIFSPVKKLGDMVTKGDVWGYVTDLATGEATTVFADDTGMVLFLRCDAVVKEGDSLGGILSINSKTLRHE